MIFKVFSSRVETKWNILIAKNRHFYLMNISMLVYVKLVLHFESEILFFFHKFLNIKL